MTVRKNWLSFWRKVHGLSQSDLAQLILGVTYVTVNNWGRDVTTPTQGQVHALAQLLPASIRDLFPFEPY